MISMKGCKKSTHALARQIKLRPLQLIEYLDELPEEASQLRRELVLVGDVRCALGEAGLAW